ncbi:MAG: DinB family protein [Acidobacteria bacterium]|jgi:hypothetical protein|nr:DinB family protein [Acidobacteriota bacterium]
MKNLKISRPQADEFDAYYERYVSLVAGEDIISALQNQIGETLRLLGKIVAGKADFRYADGKWSVKELVGHVIDTERIFAYRALRIARGDRMPIEGYEQDDYIKNADFAACRLADLAKEFSLVRRANVLMFQNLTADAWRRRGTANSKEISVRALAYICAGHEIYHTDILKQRYSVV